MKARLPLWLMLGSSLTFLASLYLPWEEIRSTQPPAGSSSGLASLLALLTAGGSGSPDAWWSGFGQAAGLLALALAAGVVLAVTRPQLTGRLPFSSGAVALGIFAVLAVWQVRDQALSYATYGRLTVDVAYGSYLGLASAAVACFAGVALRRDQLERGDAFTTLAAAGLSAGLLAAFLIPEITYNAPPRQHGWTGYQHLPPYFAGGLSIFIVGLACFTLPLWADPGRKRARIAASAAIVVLAAGQASTFSTRYWPWELWLVLGCSLGLLALALGTGRGLRVSRLSVADAATLVAASLFLVSLFLPWQRIDSFNGWAAAGSFPGGLVVIALVLWFAFGFLPVELIAASAIYVAATGVSIADFWRFEYGAPLGFAGMALLLLTAARRVGRILLSPQRLIRLVPALACAAFLAVPIAAMTNPMSRYVYDSPWRLFWLELTGVLLALRLLGRWLGGTSGAKEVLALPLLLFAITGLDLIYTRGRISWEGWGSIGLCLVLLLLGWIEVRGGGLESFSEIWRVDRISAVEN